jgi:hypothetical protein
MGKEIHHIETDFKKRNTETDVPTDSFNKRKTALNSAASSAASLSLDLKLMSKSALTNPDRGRRKVDPDALERSLKELADIKFALDQSTIVAITDQRGIAGG